MVCMVADGESSADDICAGVGGGKCTGRGSDGRRRGVRGREKLMTCLTWRLPEVSETRRRGWGGRGGRSSLVGWGALIC